MSRFVYPLCFSKCVDANCRDDLNNTKLLVIAGCVEQASGWK